MKLVIAGATGTVGHHVREAALSRGHGVVALSRSSGQDVVTGAGIADAIVGADAVIDVTSNMVLNARKARAFFTAATRNLLAAEEKTGVTHHIALSIVGIDDIDASYYAGKLAQEREVTSGPVPWSLLRAAQFHEFAEQILRTTAMGPLVAAPKTLMRPVAAREVGEHLVDLAEAGPSGRVQDLVGPQDEQLADLIRRMLAFDGINRRVVELSLPGSYWRGLASGALRGSTTAARGRTTFDEWLRSPDHTPSR